MKRTEKYAESYAMEEENQRIEKPSAYCPNCDEPLKETSVYCSLCGEKVSKVSKASADTPESKDIALEENPLLSRFDAMINKDYDTFYALRNSRGKIVRRIGGNPHSDVTELKKENPSFSLDEELRNPITGDDFRALMYRFGVKRAYDLVRSDSFEESKNKAIYMMERRKRIFCIVVWATLLGTSKTVIENTFMVQLGFLGVLAVGIASSFLSGLIVSSLARKGAIKIRHMLISPILILAIGLGLSYVFSGSTNITSLYKIEPPTINNHETEWVQYTLDDLTYYMPSQVEYREKTEEGYIMFYYLDESKNEFQIYRYSSENFPRENFDYSSAVSALAESGGDTFDWDFIYVNGQPGVKYTRESEFEGVRVFESGFFSFYHDKLYLLERFSNPSNGYPDFQDIINTIEFKSPTPTPTTGSIQSWREIYSFAPRLLRLVEDNVAAPDTYLKRYDEVWGTLTRECGDIVWGTLTGHQRDLVNYPSLNKDSVHYADRRQNFHSIIWCYGLLDAQNKYQTTYDDAMALGLFPCSKCVANQP